MVAALLTVAAGGGCLGSVVIGRHRAQAVADLAALAAAAALPAGTQPACAQASRLARRMGVDDIVCRTDGLDVIITAAVPVAVSGWASARAVATARAGPIDTR